MIFDPESILLAEESLRRGMKRVLRDGSGDADSAGCGEEPAYLVSAFSCLRILSSHFH